MATEGTGASCARDLGQGWKVSPYVKIEPKATFVLAEIEGPGAIQQIWMTPAGNWSWTPGCADVGTYEVCITVSDPNHLDWDTCCFMVTVTQESPTLNCVGQIVHYAETLSYFIDG